MRELHLFAGAGGGLLASALLGHEIVAAVEIDPYRRRVLEARKRELGDFEIHADIKTFDGESMRGRVDLVSGGFPCQAFSSAARGRNTAPDLWPEMLRVIDGARPVMVFAENVKKGPIERAAEDLSDRGYRTAYVQLSAARLGAPHRRDRWWLLGDANKGGESVGAEHAEASRMPRISGGLWSAPDPIRIRAQHGMAGRMDRMRAVGDGQVPIVAAAAFRILERNLA